MINFFNSALEKLKNQNESTVEEEDQAIDSIAKLFVEAASIDGEISEEEYNHIQTILINQLKLNELKAKKILEQVISESQNEIEIWSKTKEIRDKMDYDERLKIVGNLWEIVLIDEIVDDYEANLMRRVSGLLYISDFDSAESKKNAIKNLQNKNWLIRKSSNNYDIYC